MPNIVRPWSLRVEHAMIQLFQAEPPARRFTGNWEPTLDEIFEEPIVRRLMARDGITETALRLLANLAAERLRGRLEPLSDDRRPVQS